jgi:hypothetical protein
MKLLLCLLVFSVAWPIGARRVTRDVAQLVVATALQPRSRRGGDFRMTCLGFNAECTLTFRIRYDTKSA